MTMVCTYPHGDHDVRVGGDIFHAFLEAPQAACQPAEAALGSLVLAALDLVVDVVYNSSHELEKKYEARS
jgi:hypothetical protein